MFIVFAERAGSILLDNLSLTYQGIVLAIKTHLEQLHFCGPSGQGHDESQRSLLVTHQLRFSEHPSSEQSS